MTTVTRPEGHAGAPEYVLSVRGLRKHFPIKEGILQRVTGHVRAVDGVSLDVRRGETVGLVGESGCGKSTLGRVISGLQPPTDGGVYYGVGAADRERLDALLAAERRTPEQASELARLTARHRIDALDKARWRRYRRNCQMVFQDALSSLNPRQLVKDVVGRPLRIHREASGSALLERVVELLESVGLGRQHLYRYPHQFSGGQRQRISIARALALEPELIVLDEPTSALDVSVQAQILNLLHRLQQAHGLTYLFITHDLGVVRHMSDRIVVMYLGQVAETGPSDRVLGDPRHPYTEALLAADPSLPEADGRIRLEGAVPDPARPPAGCRFHTRCPKAFAHCGWEVDDLVAAAEGSGPLLDGLRDVHRRSRFGADLVFESEEHAGAAVAQLRGANASAALREALVELRQDAAAVTVRLEPVDPVELRALGEGRLSACLLAEPGELAAQPPGAQHGGA